VILNISISVMPASASGRSNATNEAWHIMETDEERGKEKGVIPPEGDVFSYSMLAAPAQRKTYGRFTCDAGMSYLLVFLTLAIQGVLLYCVYNKVVVENAHWVAGIMKSGEEWNLFQPEQKCNDGQALCTVKNGTYSCAPPSVQLIGRWDELDLNQDGVWSRAEVYAQRKVLKCKYAVDPVEIFDVVVAILLQHEEHIWIHPKLRAGNAIHKAYWTYAMGDIAICGYRNQDMCTNLLKRGVFHAALKYGTSPRVGSTIESALDYCHRMLAPMGVCERTLPSTYATWKLETVQQCKSAKYHKFVYKNPASGVEKSLLEVDYKARQRYATAQTPIFLVYKGMICGIWMLLVLSQLRMVASKMVWVLTFPTYEEPDAETQAMMNKKSRNFVERGAHKIVGISFRHRVVMTITSLTRIAMMCLLLYVGLSFLGRQTDYIGLLLDGVALIFIIEVQEIIYEKVIRGDVRAQWEDSEPMSFMKVGVGFLQRRPDIVDMMWLFIIAASASLFMWSYTRTLVRPLHDALNCACLSEGDKCFEKHRFSTEFWDQYWRYDVPDVFNQINTLKNGFSAWGDHLVKGSMREGGVNHQHQMGYDLR